MKNKKSLIGIIIFIILIAAIIIIKNFNNGETNIFTTNLTTIYVATGGGKED